MITMSVPPNGGGPPLPKRTSSQRQPRVTNHALQALRSNSTDSAPPLPPHHPESNTLPRTKKNEPAVPGKNGNPPEVPTRAGRRVFEDGGPGIQRKTFETKSFVERNTARVFSDPTKIENKSVKIRRSYNSPRKTGFAYHRPPRRTCHPPTPIHTLANTQTTTTPTFTATRALPALPPEPAESNVKQNLRDRPLPPPPSAESIPSPERSPSAPEHERPLPPPPSIRTIPTGRRPSITDNSTHSDEPLPPPPPIQSIPTKPASGKSIHIPAAFEPSNAPAPPPLSRQQNTYHVKLQQQSSDDSPPPLPPSRPRGQSLGSKISQHRSTNTHEYEKRFVFHDESEFPEPESFSGKKKEYPSQVIDKRKTRAQNSLGAL